ncbi:hypothetical protein QBC37DRAFT_479724 [Rhypophila decipiens]|uniref:Uncharacterized protein n=1 Tax=Rhypophila decipiens TaxID=261697 RepID=A0AAN7B9E5_9PEZI|nr:hypothetical protein QBC37DRAFT_479724 [Rhypophila decipiens]
MLAFNAGCIIVVLLSTLSSGTDISASPKHKWTPTDDSPNWKMTITNLSADSMAMFPYAEFYLTLLPGKFVPHATCHGHVLNPLTPQNNKPYPLPSTDWVNCSLPDLRGTPHPNGTNFTGPPTGPPISAQSNHTAVKFRWIQLVNGGAVLKVQTNMSFATVASFEKALDSMVGVWPPPRNWKKDAHGRQVKGVGILREMAKEVVSSGHDVEVDASGTASLYIWQQGTFNISATDISIGEAYTGQRNRSTVVDWVGICDEDGDCHEKD